MSVNSLRRDAARMLREWQVWENLWLRYWNLPEAWSRAANDVHVDYFLQAVADRTLHDIEDILELSKEDREVERRRIINTTRTKLKITRKTTEISKERLDKLPKLASTLRKKCGGDHRTISKRLDKAYQFIAHGDVLKDDTEQRDALRAALGLPKPIDPDGGAGEGQRKRIPDRILFSRLRNNDPISYPEEIRNEVMELFKIFIDIEQKIIIERSVREHIEIIEINGERIIIEIELRRNI